MNIPAKEFLLTFLKDGDIIYRTSYWGWHFGPSDKVIKEYFNKQEKYKKYDKCDVYATGREELFD